MTYNRERHHRRSIRLPGYDYAQAGAYFITIVCKDRELQLEEPASRDAVEQSWQWLAAQYTYVELDEYVVMPNHLHGIIVIEDSVGAVREPPLLRARKPLGRLIGAFKTVSTKRINRIKDTPGHAVWQRNYYEHIIRSEAELSRIRQYISENPARWSDDSENPAVVDAVREPALTYTST